MAAHTIIFSTGRCALSEDGILNFVIDKLKEDATAFEYFGEEIDNPFDFDHDESLNELIESTCYITFNFDTENEIPYSETDPKKYAISLLTDQKTRILIDEKNIDVFLD